MLARRRLPHLYVIGQPLFITFRLYASAEAKHYRLHSWVIMPNHVHLLLTPKVSVSRLLGSLKAATAKRANLLVQRTGQPFWQDGSYDHLIRNGDEFWPAWPPDQRIMRGPAPGGL